jgi:hypothetical protein
LAFNTPLLYSYCGGFFYATIQILRYFIFVRDKQITMDIEQLHHYTMTLGNVEESLPFGPDTIVYKINNKIFLTKNFNRISLNFFSSFFWGYFNVLRHFLKLYMFLKS